MLIYEFRERERKKSKASEQRILLEFAVKLSVT